MRISLVIPILNEARSLPSLLQGIAQQSLLPEEAVFVDSGSTDRSEAILADQAVRSGAVAIRFVRNAGGLPGGNRNVGIRAASGDWIAFLDAGIVPERTWLEKLAACAATSGTAGVFGVCRFDAVGPVARSVCAISYGCGTTHPVLPASLFRRSVFDEVGYFPAEFRAAEDILWLQAFERRYGPRKICPEALVHYTHFPETLGQVARKYWRYERESVRAGVARVIPLWIAILAAAVLAVAMIAAPLWTGVFCASLLVIRGLIEPVRRSRERPWWRGVPTAVPTAIAICALRDASKILGRIWK